MLDPENISPQQPEQSTSNELIEEKRSLVARLAGRLLTPTDIILEDAQTFSDAATETLQNKETPAPYEIKTKDELDFDYLQKFRKKHMTPPSGFGFGGIETPRASMTELSGQGARTPLQKQAELRANLRLDAIDKRDHTIRKFTSLYGDILFDKDAVEEQLSSGRFSNGQKRAIRRASKHVRRSQAARERINQRLHNSASGNDIPGKLVSNRIKIQKKLLQED